MYAMKERKACGACINCCSMIRPPPRSARTATRFTPATLFRSTIRHLSAVTERLRYLTTVYILPARMPAHVAKQVDTAAVLSGNRVSLGVGMGWMEEEFEASEIGRAHV